MATTPEQIERLRQALAEVRAHQSNFTRATYGLLIMSLLRQLRDAQTTAYTQPSQTDEMRLVTVMFIDVKDSTEIAQRLDASEWKQLISGAHERITQVIMQHQGQVGQYLGDGVLCFFGAQQAQHDDTLRAVACAIAIQKTIADYAAMVAEQYEDLAFGIRIGMSTGLVVVGMMGSPDRQELLAMGLTTNLAARLQAVAPVGGILVDKDTHARIREEYVTQLQAPQALKGFDDIDAYHVLGKRNQSITRFTDTSIQDIPLPLVGRDATLAQIQYICETASMQAEGHAITLLGEIGLGKSRLLQEVVELNSTQFMPIIMRPSASKQNQALNLFHSWLTTQCQLDDAQTHDEKRQLIRAYLMQLCSERMAYATTDAFLKLLFQTEADRDTREKALDQVFAFFQEIAEQHHLMIVIDNLHWADKQSVALLEQLASLLTHQSSLIIATARPSYQSSYPSYLATHPRHEIITLERLSANTTLDLINAILQHIERTPTDLTQHLLDRVEGNPLFVREFLTVFFDQQAFQKTDAGYWRFNLIYYEKALQTLPHGLVSLLQARLDELSAEDRYLIQIAAVSGLRFWQSALETITQHPLTEDTLSTLTMRGMIDSLSTGTFADDKEYSFQHSLYRDVAYAMLPSQDRKQAHQHMAEWLLLRVADKPELYPQVAHHLKAAEAHEVALYTYLDVTLDRIQRDKLGEALTLIEQGLAIARNVPRQDALQIVINFWMWRASILIDLERYGEASAAGQSALRLYDELADASLVYPRIQIQRTLGIAYLSLGRFDAAYDALSDAHSLLPRDALRAITDVLSALGRLNLYRGRLPDAAAYAKRAMQNAKRTQDPRQLATILTLLGHIAQESGQLSQAYHHYQDTVAFNNSRQQPSLQVASLRDLGYLYMTLMHLDQAHTCFEQARIINDKLDRQDSLLDSCQGLLLIQTGQPTSGLKRLYAAQSHISQDVYLQQKVQLTFIAGLGTVGNYTDCYEQAVNFCEQHKDSNPLAYARGLRWLSIASTELGLPQAEEQRQAALIAEQHYGGRDLWRCHAMLARYAHDEGIQQQHYAAAADELHNQIERLKTEPELYEAFHSTPDVQAILAHVTG